jgi:hypothetical protein
MAPSSTEVASAGASPVRGWLWLILLLFFLECALFIAFAADGMGPPAYLQCHLGLCAATAALGGWWAAASAASDRADRIAMVVQLVAWTALAGPFGAFIAAGLLMPRAAVANADAAGQPDVAARFNAAPLSRLELLHRSLLDRRLRLDGAHVIRPLLDVVIDGAQIEKFDALGLISKRYVPAAAPALKRALEDKDGSVRVLAATVMAQQHNAYTKRIGSCQAIASAAPHSASGWSDLGQAHLNYANSGLLEASRAETELSHARTHLARAQRLGRDETSTTKPLDSIGRLAALLEQPTVEHRASPHAS